MSTQPAFGRKRFGERSADAPSAPWLDDPEDFLEPSVEDAPEFRVTFCNLDGQELEPCPACGVWCCPDGPCEGSRHRCPAEEEA